MKNEFIVAITQLSAEKNLPKEVVLDAVESALVSAYKKDTFGPHQNISVKINPNTGEVKVYVQRTVVEALTDQLLQVSITEAHKLKKDAQIGDILDVESTLPNAGRIAAQTAKQVILQRLHEAEHHAIYEEFSSKEGDIVAGIVQRVESRQIYVDVGRTEAILPDSEQAHNEHYRVGQKLKLYVLEVAKTNKGPQIIVSRSHRNLLRRLFELEVPEVFSGVVELKSVAREAGYRSKVAVAARQENVDPVGCCVGLRGIRIQHIVNELNGEKIDVVQWHPDPRLFITSALSPAPVSSVELNEEKGIATVVVPDKQLSLAIGREGQNARLAAKLTGWRIDIKTASAAEMERLSLKEEVAPETAEAIVLEKEPVTVDELLTLEQVSDAETKEEAEVAIPLAGYDFASEISLAEPIPEQPQIRFAEDVLSPKSVPVGKNKKKKKTTAKKDMELREDRIKLKKVQQMKQGGFTNEEIEEEW